MPSTAEAPPAPTTQPQMEHGGGRRGDKPIALDLLPPKNKPPLPTERGGGWGWSWVWIFMLLLLTIGFVVVVARNP